MNWRLDDRFKGIVGITEDSSDFITMCERDFFLAFHITVTQGEVFWIFIGKPIDCKQICWEEGKNIKGNSTGGKLLVNDFSIVESLEKVFFGDDREFFGLFS